MKNKLVILIVAIVFVILFLKRKSLMTYDLLSSLLTKFEGFSAFPYWDVKRYSWGYGTQVPDKYIQNGKPIKGTQISRANAFVDAYNHIKNDEAYLKPLIKITLNSAQWAAFLSFSFNEGAGNAKNLVANINSKKWNDLGVQWNKYIYSDNKINPNLVARRKYEWQLFKNNIS